MAELRDLLAELTSGDEARAEAACASLVEQGDAAIPALCELLDSPDADARWWAARTLASLPNLDPGLLLPPLTDTAPEVRQCAALGLCAHPSEAAIPPLVRALSDDDILTAELASRALVAIGPSAVPALLDVLANAEQAARLHAMRALSEVGDECAIRPMIEAIGESSAMLGYWAEKGLERLGVNMVYLKP